jgi:hypothetical protein
MSNDQTKCNPIVYGDIGAFTLYNLYAGKPFEDFRLYHLSYKERVSCKPSDVNHHQLYEEFIQTLVAMPSYANISDTEKNVLEILMDSSDNAEALSPPQPIPTKMDKMEKINKVPKVPLRVYMNKLGIQLKKVICLKGHETIEDWNQCRNANNGLAHSVKELSEQFNTPDMKAYYQKHFKESANYYNIRYIAPNIKCQRCRMFGPSYISPSVATHQLNYETGMLELIKPAIHAKCTCGHLTKISIYCC